MHAIHTYTDINVVYWNASENFFGKCFSAVAVNKSRYHRQDPLKLLKRNAKIHNSVTIKQYITDELASNSINSIIRPGGNYPTIKPPNTNIDARVGAKTVLQVISANLERQFSFLQLIAKSAQAA